MTKGKITEWFNAIWYQKKPLAWYIYILYPFSMLYLGIVSLRKLLFRLRIKSVSHFDVPVIVVGNVTVGGTGKTPMVVWLAEWLQAEGFHPGIVSRGYHAKTQHFPHAVTPESDVKLVGDEALMLAGKTGLPVVIDPKRAAAVASLLQNSGCDVVISDDGLQHYALGRDIEIALIDAGRRCGNGHVLPLGPLREPSRRLSSVDFVVCNGAAQVGEFEMVLRSDFAVGVNDSNNRVDPKTFKGRTIHAVAAIGNPERFFRQLDQYDLTFVKHVFPDHYDFTSPDFNFLKQDDIVIMTEKDAVKCRRFADTRFYFLPVRAELPAAFARALQDKLKSLS